MIQELITQCEAQALDDAFLNMRRDGVAFTGSDRMDSADVAIARMRNLNGALIQLKQIAAMAHTLGRLVAEYDSVCFDIDLADVAHAIDKAACELDQPDVMDVLEIRKEAALSFRDDERMEQRRAA